jgi:hypothetical protein
MAAPSAAEQPAMPVDTAEQDTIEGSSSSISRQFDDAHRSHR